MSLGVHGWRRTLWFGLAFMLVVLSVLLALLRLGALPNVFYGLIGGPPLEALWVVLAIALGVWGRRKPPTPQTIADALTQQVIERAGLELNDLLLEPKPGPPASLVRCTGNGTQVEAAKVAGFYRTQCTGGLLVLGAPGAGKTVLLLRLIHDLAEARDALSNGQQRGTVPVPLRFDLAEWDTTHTLEDWLAATMTARFAGLTRQQATTLLERRLILPVLDGLDEMDDANHEPTRAREAVRQLNRYRSGPEPNPLVVACREEDYERLGTGLTGADIDASTLRITPLPQEEVDRYVRQQLAHEADSSALSAWDRFCQDSPAQAF